MPKREADREHEQAVRFGILREENVPAWTEIDTGRYQPRRVKGSFRGRELG